MAGTSRRRPVAAWLLAPALLAGAASAAIADAVRTADRLEADWAAFSGHVRENYWREVDIQALRMTCDAAASFALASSSSREMSHEACVRAAVQSLDPRSRYITASDVEAMDQPRRRFVGIGIELSRPRTPGPVDVVQPIRGAPSERAGLRPGDQIYAIDGTDITPLAMSEIFQLFRGEPGTPITVTLRRGAEQQERVIAMTRAEIRASRARAVFFPAQRVLWMRVTQFAGDAKLQLAKAIEEAVGASPLRPRRLILDLRGNPGGLLEEVVNTAAVFLDPGTVVYEEIRSTGTIPKRAPAELPQDVLPHLPASALRELRQLRLTVLVDGRTTFGSEMMVVALKDYRAARVVGKPTPGDNSITRMLRLPSGAAVEITNAKMTSAAGSDWTLHGVPVDEVRDEGIVGSRMEYGDLTVDKLLEYELNR